MVGHTVLPVRLCIRGQNASSQESMRIIRPTERAITGDVVEIKSEVEVGKSQPAPLTRVISLGQFFCPHFTSPR